MRFNRNNMPKDLMTDGIGYVDVTDVWKTVCPKEHEENKHKAL